MPGKVTAATTGGAGETYTISRAEAIPVKPIKTSKLRTNVDFFILFSFAAVYQPLLIGRILKAVGFIWN